MVVGPTHRPGFEELGIVVGMEIIIIIIRNNHRMDVAGATYFGLEPF